MTKKLMKEMLNKENEKLNLKRKVKRISLREQGITLIALVVTIIILLILAGVTLNIALSDNGLFNKTKKAAEDYREAQSEEEDLIRQMSTQFYSEYVGATVEGYSPAESKDGVTINGTTSGLDSNKKDDAGNTFDNVDVNGNQTFEAESMSWRVWDYDGNTLRIIGDPTEKKLTLKGAAGYNNGVWVIDNICKTLYSNEAKGAKATSLKRTDIQKVSTYDYTQYKHAPDNPAEDTSEGNEKSIYFGATKTYTNNNQYPDMWSENDKNWTYKYSKDDGATGEDKECKKWEVIGNGKMNNAMNEGNSETTFKQSYYAHNYESGEFINGGYYDLIFKKASDEKISSFWLDSRSVFFFTEFCGFGLDHICWSEGVNGAIDAYLLGFSDRTYGCN